MAPPMGHGKRPAYVDNPPDSFYTRLNSRGPYCVRRFLQY